MGPEQGPAWRMLEESHFCNLGQCFFFFLIFGVPDLSENVTKSMTTFLERYTYMSGTHTPFTISGVL